MHGLGEIRSCQCDGDHHGGSHERWFELPKKIAHRDFDKTRCYSETDDSSEQYSHNVAECNSNQTEPRPDEEGGNDDQQREY